MVILFFKSFFEENDLAYQNIFIPLSVVELKTNLF